MAKPSKVQEYLSDWLDAGKPSRIDKMVSTLGDATPGSRAGKYEDGQQPRHGDDIHYAFSARFPREIALSGTAHVDISNFVDGMAEDASRDESPEAGREVRESLQELFAADGAKIVTKAVKDTFAAQFPEIDDAQVDKLSDAIHEPMDVHMTAYKSDGEEVDLGEYPNLNILWRLTDGKINVGEVEQISAMQYSVPITMSWSVEVKDWLISNWSADIPRTWPTNLIKMDYV